MTNITTFTFDGKTVLAADLGDVVVIPTNPICNLIGIDAATQNKIIMADPVMSQGVRVIPYPSKGGEQSMVCLRLDLVHGWIFRINPNKVSKDARPKLIAFQTEGFKVLFEHFYSRRDDLQQPAAHSMSDEMKQRWIGLALRCGGAKAGTQMWQALGAYYLPALADAQRQREFHFKVDPVLDAIGPSDVDEVN